MPHPRFTTDEIADRGRALYESQIRAQVEPGNKGKVLVLDIETGQYEIDSDHLAAGKRALEKHPGAALYSIRIGHPALSRIGAKAAGPA